MNSISNVPFWDLDCSVGQSTYSAWKSIPSCPYASSFEKVLVGKPLLSEPDDYKKTVHAVMEDVDLEGGF